MPLGNGGLGGGGMTSAGKRGGAAEPLRLEGNDGEGRGGVPAAPSSVALGAGAVLVALGAAELG
jgi:hypothetical protein